MMHAPMSFFDATPAGRITSRFGADLGMVDNMMFNQLDFTMTFGFTFLVMCGTVIAKMPLMAILFAIAGVLSVPVVHGLIIFQQDIKRHSNTAMSPILSNLGETQRGAALSSVLGCSAYFIERHFKSCDAWSHLVDSALVTTLMAELWCQLLHLVVLAAVGAFTIHDMDNLRRSPGLIAMYFSYAALWGIFAAITMGVLMGLFTNMTSLERLLEYKLGGLAQEPAWSKASDPASTAWPTSGVVQFDNISLRYREGLPLALADLTLDVGGQEKLGIVGRTGAGKSSITSVLFRLVDCECGRVLIDGVDICGLGVHTLRRAISMIPQEPIVMSGTIRYNLDPFGKHSEEELLRVMSDAGLSSALSLDTAAGGGGASLSAGQRQLVTFGRTLLQGTRLVVMDEPTASVDMQTDRLLQSVARVAFAKKTVMTIAHRLETVRDCDRIAVMEAGRLVELGPPEELLSDPKSHLAKMYRASGENGGQANGEREVDSELKEVMEFMI
jgi:ABC-type multidrug transport system fused ATPase/permease subunit